MKHSMEFELAWQGLKPGVHEYESEVGMEFMTLHGEARHEYKDIQAQVKLRFDKHEGFFQLHFDIGGHIITPCDRCGDEFRMELWDEFDLVVKLTGGDEDLEEDEDADVVFIPRSETVIDVSKWIYEFIILSIPIQRIHPNNSDGKPGCNEAALKLLGDMSEHKEEQKNDIWKGLESIRITDNNKRK